jgi:hypothetical protein
LFNTEIYSTSKQNGWHKVILIKEQIKRWQLVKGGIVESFPDIHQGNLMSEGQMN